MILCLSIAGFASADNFSIRNGVTFGMSLGQVKSIETNAGLKQTEIYGHEYGTSYRFSGEEKNISILGDPSTAIDYYFSKQSKELEIIRFLIYGDNYTRFKSLSDSLNSKYGRPSYTSSTGELSIFTDAATLDWLDRFHKPNSEYEQWIVEFDDISVGIVLCFTYTDIGINFCQLTYSRIPKQDIEKQNNLRNEI